MFKGFSTINSMVGLEVTILTTDGFKEKGIIKSILAGAGENSVFIELDTGVLINTRYVIQIIVKK